MQSKASAAGDRALLVELGDVTAAELHAAAAEVRARPDVLACIVGQSSLYVIFSREVDLSPGVWIGAPRGTNFAVQGESAPIPHSEWVFDVSFADEYASDLPAFLEHAGVTRDAFLCRVDGLILTARYLGFRAGFAYLEGWPAEWAMPRRPTSRPVARGSFAIGGAMAGFYPLDSPGGWNVLGRTGAPLAHRIRAGDTIAIRPTLERVVLTEEPREEPLRIDGVELQSPFARVVAPANYANLERAVPPGGPFDELAAALANRAVGNREDAPVIECAMAGPRVRFRDRRFVAWFGAESDVAQEQPFAVEGGSELQIGRIRNGLRGYLAVGDARGVAARVERGGRNVIRVRREPHDSPIGTVECEVTPQLDRVGIRLRPLQPLGVAAPANLPSCGMQCGTIQLHPDGSLVAMGPDHPITGGYLQPLTVLWDERWKLAQLMPGERVTLSVDY
jgi:allophanate hydrolase subunit 1